MEQITYLAIRVGTTSMVIKGGIIISKKYNYEEYLGKTINKLTINSYDIEEFK